jgi:hypothetical protein
MNSRAAVGIVSGIAVLSFGGIAGAAQVEAGAEIDASLVPVRVVGTSGCTCGTPEQRSAARLAIDAAHVARARADRVLLSDGGPGRSAGLDIVLDVSAAVAADPAFVATLERAVSRWEQLVSSDVRILYSVDFTSGEPFVAAASSAIIGHGPYEGVRAALVSRAGADTADFINALPATRPDHVGAGGLNSVPVYADPRAIRKVLGFDDPQDISRTDATIVFNTDFDFDLDNSDGVTPGSIDLESVMVHEIGHAMGFTSGVDSQFVRVTLDMFRFGIDGASNDPQTLSDISDASLPRELRIGVEAGLDTVGAVVGYEEVFRFSTGVNGDGRQAGHWKADELLNIPVPIGVMDPSVPLDALAPGYFTDADRLAFRLLGWDIELPGQQTCPEDVDGSGVVGTSDLLALLSQWGASVPAGTGADITGDGFVGVSDLLELLSAWGTPC